MKYPVGTKVRVISYDGAPGPDDDPYSIIGQVGVVIAPRASIPGMSMVDFDLPGDIRNGAWLFWDSEIQEVTE
jgi:hypothetical protein